MFHLIVRDKVTRQCPQTTIFEEKGVPKRIGTEVTLLTARPNRLTRRIPLAHGIYSEVFLSPSTLTRHEQGAGCGSKGDNSFIITVILSPPSGHFSACVCVCLSLRRSLSSLCKRVSTPLGFRRFV